MNLSPVARLRTKRGIILFVVLMTVYSVNGDYLPGNDAKANLYLAVNLLNHGKLSFSPEEFPFMFKWRFKDPEMTMNPEAIPPTELIQSGAVEVDGPRYYLVSGARDGAYVIAFSPGSGFMAVPVFAVLKWTGHDPSSHLSYFWYGGKLVASSFVAASAVLIYFAAAEFVAAGPALMIALSYGLGTCVWSISSQTLWQHGPTEFFLALGAWLLIQSRGRKGVSVLCSGAALGAAVVCRPTSIAVVVAVGIYLLLVDKRALLLFVLGGAPLAVALLTYNWYYLGSPLAFGETGNAGAQIALAKTGSPDLWQTPLLNGALGLLVSPSRGLFVYSPFLLLALPSFARILRDARYRVLIPLIAGGIGMMVIAFKWFDWWGGWSYGYRPLVDTMPLVILLFIPNVADILARPARRAVFLTLLIWSIGVQAIGAFAYELWGWNARRRVPPVYAAVLSRSVVRQFVATDDREALNRAREMGAIRVVESRQDIDLPEFRSRLWSIRDSQIVYYFANFNESRRIKKALIDLDLKRQ